MSKNAAAYVVLTAFYVQDDDGADHYYKVGDIVRGDNAVLKGREELFSALPDDAPDLADPRFVQPEDKVEPEVVDVEPATEPTPDPESEAAPTKPARKTAAKKTAKKA